MTELVSFFLVLLVAVMFSAVFKKFHLPWVVALLIGGMVIGPFGFDVLQIDSSLSFIAEVGLIFLMFMAGLETKLSHLTHNLGAISLVAVFNSVIPFLAGAIIALAFGYSGMSALMVGILFISSSVAVVVPVLENANLMTSWLGRSIVSTTLVQDILSLLLLSFFFQLHQPVMGLPVWSVYLMAVVFFVLMRRFVPKVNQTFAIDVSGQSHDIFQKDFRIVFTFLIGAVIIFELLGLHPIIGAFAAGLMLSDTISSEAFMDKLRTIAYGVFIPIFFVVIGAQTDLSALRHIDEIWLMLLVLVGGLLSTKYISGYLGARATGFSPIASKLSAAATLPQLSTTLAVAFIGLEVGILDQTLITLIVILTIISTMIAPILMNRYIKKLKISEPDSEV